MNFFKLFKLTMRDSHCRTRHFAQQQLTDRQKELMRKNLPAKKPIPNVKDIVLVSSGKGGVGKSTTAANLAIALARSGKGKTVGLLDADVFGPTIPQLMNLNDSPLVDDANMMLPLTNYGVKCMSMGFLVAQNAALIWRGLMVIQALEKLMRQVNWGCLDILVVDTPPGTGDTHLSLIQNLPITGVVLVSTPQLASLQVTKRGAIMLEKMDVPVIGIVENMSSVHCPKCHAQVPLFRTNVQQLADELNIKMLAQVPLNSDIDDGSDNGVPVVVGHPESVESNIYRKLSDDVYNFVDRNRRI